MARRWDDIISYVPGITNMVGGELVIGVEDGTLNLQLYSSASCVEVDTAMRQPFK